MHNNHYQNNGNYYGYYYTGSGVPQQLQNHPTSVPTNTVTTVGTPYSGYVQTNQPPNPIYYHNTAAHYPYHYNIFPNVAIPNQGINPSSIPHQANFSYPTVPYDHPVAQSQQYNIHETQAIVKTDVPNLPASNSESTQFPIIIYYHQNQFLNNPRPPQQENVLLQPPQENINSNSMEIPFETPAVPTKVDHYQDEPTKTGPLQSRPLPKWLMEGIQKIHNEKSNFPDKNKDLSESKNTESRSDISGYKLLNDIEEDDEYEPDCSEFSKIDSTNNDQNDENETRAKILKLTTKILLDVTSSQIRQTCEFVLKNVSKLSTITSSNSTVQLVKTTEGLAALQQSDSDEGDEDPEPVESEPPFDVKFPIDSCVAKKNQATDLSLTKNKSDDLQSKNKSVDKSSLREKQSVKTSEKRSNRDYSSRDRPSRHRSRSSERPNNRNSSHRSRR